MTSLGPSWPIFRGLHVWHLPDYLWSFLLSWRVLFQVLLSFLLVVASLNWGLSSAQVVRLFSVKLFFHTWLVASFPWKFSAFHNYAFPKNTTILNVYISKTAGYQQQQQHYSLMPSNSEKNLNIICCQNKF